MKRKDGKEMARIINPYFGLDMLAIARWQYGPIATLHPYPAHAWGWAAKLPGSDTKLGLNLQGYVDYKFGNTTRVVMKGMGPNDWACFKVLDTDYVVQPVTVLAKEAVWDVQKVKDAVDIYFHNVCAMSDWYATQLGRGYKVLQPVVIPGTRTIQDWYNILVDQADRYDLYKACQQELSRYYGGKLNENIVYAVTQFCGDKPTWDADAAGGRLANEPGYQAVVSAFACCHRYALDNPSEQDNVVAYCLAHELGHCFGLPHTDPVNGDARGIEKAVMIRNYPPDAILVPYEKVRLDSSPFFPRN